VFNPAERERLSAAIGTIAAQVRAAAPAVAAVAAGITGFGSGVADDVKAILSSALQVVPDRLTVVDDITLAYAAVFSPGEGHLVSSGTGSVGLHLSPEAGYVRVGGRGILIDDAGSGSWIALRALDEIFRSFDRTGNFSEVQALADELFAVVGDADWHAVRQFVYGGDRGSIGTLSTGVAKAAVRGDATALAILQQAGRELASLARALAARTEAKPARFIGGVIKLHPIITSTISAELEGCNVGYPSIDAALTAAKLHVEGTDWQRTFMQMHSVAPLR
jgi:N-acetylglucosamine kinase-like BadF-type ATPase